MKNTENNTKKRNINKISSSFFHKIGRNAYLDWIFIFSLSVILAIVLSLVAYLAYDGTAIANKSPKAKSNNKQKVLFDEKAMERVLNNYDSMSNEYKQAEKGYVGVSDPSI